MPKTVQKTLSFPLAGVARRGVYREQGRPYAAPWAVNVRGVGPLERRERGGSRPGLAKVYTNSFGSRITALIPVTSIDAAGVRYRDLIIVADGTFSRLRGSSVTASSAAFTTNAGAAILTAGGEAIVFESEVGELNTIGASGAFDAVERGGKLYLADAVLREYNPLTGAVAPVAATAGIVPTGQPLAALYRDRLILAGADHVWYASRQGVPTDWNLAADSGDVGRAVAGHVERAGRIGEVVTAVIPLGDAALVFASSNAMWMLRGEPTDGSMSQLSDDIGVLSPTAWARSPDGVAAFLSNDGVYVMGGAEPPKRWSAERVPEELKNVNPATNTITMAYDVRGRGFDLFVTPTTGVGTHWWLDIDNKAIWPVRLQDGHQPVAVSRVQGSSGMAEVIFGCKDGYLRKFSASATTDDGTAIQSHVLVGPFRLASDDVTDALLAEIHGIMADNTGALTWRVVMGSSAEAATDTAVAGIASALAGTAIAGVAASGTWAENRNRVVRPRARGAWGVVWISAAAPWAYEAVAVVINQLGRLR